MLPYLKGNLILLEKGSVNIDSCQVQDLEKLFGKPLRVFGSNNHNELAFPWSMGAIRAFPLITSQLGPKTQIQLLHFILEHEIPLKEIALWYDCLPAYYLVKHSQETEYFALFNLRFQTKFEPATNLVKVLSFVNQDHVLTCICPECTLIRQEVKNVQPIATSPQSRHLQ